MKIPVIITALSMSVLVSQAQTDTVQAQAQPQAQAQKPVKRGPTITWTNFASYTFSDKFTTDYGDGRVEDGFQWGGGLEIGLTQRSAFEIIYQRIRTDAYYYGIGQHRYSGKIDMNYLMLGGTKFLPLGKVVSGFGTINGGVGWFNTSESLESKSSTKFSIGGRLGLQFKTSEKVSIRIHGQVFSPVQWAGAGFYFGTGGAGTGVSTGSTIWQFNLGGSLNIRLR